MVSTPSKSQFSLLCFFTLILIVHSTPTLLPSDHNALFLVLQEIGIRHAPGGNPCDTIGIFCERRIANHSYVLRITRLVFESQQLKGRLSPVIGQLSELKELSLPNNQLFDQIPAQILACSKLEVLNLESNQFSGKIPLGISSLIRLRILDLSSNKFGGSLKFLKYFPNLEKLNLADNMFAGKVPASLRSFRNLIFVNISGNSLLEEGQVSWENQMEELSETSTEVENIPKRYVFVENSNGRNQSNIAMAPSSSQDFNAVAPSPMVAPSRRKHKASRRKIEGWTFGFLAGLIAGGGSGLLFALLFKLLLLLIKGRDKNTRLKIFSPMIKKPEDLAFLVAMEKK